MSSDNSFGGAVYCCAKAYSRTLQVYRRKTVLAGTILNVHRAVVADTFLANIQIYSTGFHRIQGCSVYQHTNSSVVRGVFALFRQWTVVVRLQLRVNTFFFISQNLSRSCVVIGVASQWWARTRRPRWFKSRNYLLSAALDGGSQVILFILVSRSCFTKPQWTLTLFPRASQCSVLVETLYPSRLGTCDPFA